MKPNDIDKPAEEKDETTLEELLSDLDHAISLGKPTHSEQCDRKTKENSNKNAHINSKNENPTSSNCKKSDNICETSNEIPEAVKDEKNRNRSVEQDVDMPLQKQPQQQKMDVDVEKQQIIEHVESLKPTSTSVKQTETNTANNIAKEIIENKKTNEITPEILKECLQDKKRKDDRQLHNSNIMKKSKPTCENSKIKNEKENLNKALNRILALEANLKQWVSVDTLIYLLGETAVRNVVVETNKHYKQHAEVMKQLSGTNEPQMNQLLGKHVSFGYIGFVFVRS